MLLFFLFWNFAVEVKVKVLSFPNYFGNTSKHKDSISITPIKVGLKSIQMHEKQLWFFIGQT